MHRHEWSSEAVRTKIKIYLLFMPGRGGGQRIGVGGGFLLNDTFYTVHILNCECIMYSKIRFKITKGKPLLTIPEELLTNE